MNRHTQLRATVDRAREFDPDAWEALYRRLYPRLHAYARRRLAPPHCEDAVSEVFARAMDAIERFRWRGGGFDGWVFGILRNVVLEHYRSGLPSGAPADGNTDDTASDESGPLERVVAQEQAAEVREAFGRLGSQDRELLELRVIGELDAKAVGAVVGKRPGAVRMAQARALERLGELLEERPA